MKTVVQTPVRLSHSIRRILKLNSTAAARAAAIKLPPKANFALVLLVCASSISALAATRVMAADATTASETLEEVTVTGIRASIESAIAAKRESNDVVEVVSAEDIGKLPDTSIAESISRLPGLTTQRSDGRSSDISIRGFGPDFNGTLLNGREQVSTGDNRAVQFDQYPAELIRQVVVYKTPDASVVGQGLAGTIDMRTTRPLEYGKRTLVVDFRGIKNSNNNLGSDSTDKQYRASVSYIDQFFDNTLGVTLGFARLYTPVAGEEVGTYDPWGPNGTSHAGIPAGVFVTNGIKVLASTGLDKRDGSLATLEWRPTGAFTSIFDLYYTNREEDNQRRSIEANLGNYNGLANGTAAFSNPIIVDNTLVGATVGNIVPLARNFLYITRDQIFSSGWNNKWNTGDWTLTGDLAYSRATRDEHDIETQAQYRNNVTDTGTYFLPNGSSPTFSLLNMYTDPALVTVGPTIYGSGYSRFPHVVDELKSARIDASHTLSGWFSSMIGGVNFDDRTKKKRQPENCLYSKGTVFNTGQTDASYCAGLVSSPIYQIDPKYLLPPANLSFGGTPSSLAWNVPAVINNYFDPILPTSNNSGLVGKNWGVTEKLTTLFVKGNLDHDLSADVKLRGNIGVQVIHTDQSSTAQYWDSTLNGGAGGPRPITLGKTYNDVLPSFNFVFELPDQQSARVGLAREVVRARMDQLGAYSDFGIGTSSGSLPSLSGGNPQLAPWRANAFDLSYEKYFESKADIAVSAFYKKLTTYIFNISASCDLSSYVNAIGSGYFPPGVTPVLIGTCNQPQNGSGGRVDGVELAVNLPGDLFTDALNGFGLNASVSETQSGITIPGSVAGISSTNIALPGLSKTVWQATAYFEKYGFSTRIATRYRSNYIGEITDFAGDRALEYVRHEQITDFQAGYDFKEGRLGGLSFIFQINNMTNTPFIDYVGVQSRVRDYETFGREYFLGIKYKL
jgi:iron complex outermembrane recepter protein